MPYKKVTLYEFGGPDVLKVENIAEIPEPGSGEARVKVLACSAAYTDTLIRRGIYPDVKQKPPITLGYDMIGVVDKVGGGVDNLAEGDKVAELTILGAYSEYMILDAKQLVRVPDGLDDVDALSLILSYVTAFQMLTRLAKVQAGDSVLIHGAGGAVGNALVRLGAAMKLKMYGTASGSHHDRLRDLGCEPIDYKKEDFVLRMKSYAPKGVNAVFDAMGTDHFKRSLKVIANHGTLVAYGSYNSTSSADLIKDFLRVSLWDLLPWLPSTAFYSIGAWHRKHHDWFKEDLLTLFQWLSEGKISPEVSHRMKLEEGLKAHELLDSGQAKGKVVLMIGGQ
ncbi:medium chain dehydrogenase/reductase family protein [Marinobacter sp. CHS3-4]|uniref:medium chain dehydrogenase/reductase family protein n=1 Tax=Marinobacter sp. CHS3-4 TaxID=3045174 RepID=UPI0024B58B2B|nr:medium chain dehydrogenase/reductase family protein [Marinobacter sp. CHS3-4]MDI9245360.1 medium chain dehydrogenase/reductase family protein [Marinobacter sp. CHS3-4]